jgi:hypothetical protein
MSIEAMKQALEALEIEDSACRHEKEITPEHIASSITALRQAIQQAEKQEKLCKYCGGIGRVACDGRCMPKQVPVASMMVDLFNAAGIGISFEPSEVTHIYSTGASTAEKQEPVALQAVYETIIQWDKDGGKRSRRELARRIVDRYTAPMYTKPENIDTKSGCVDRVNSEPVAWSERELELIDGMIEVQLNHAEQCDRIANRPLAEKQKGWDMERVAILQKIKAAPPKPWVGLTDKEIQQVVYDLGTIGDLSHDEFDIARAVIAKLKEKNT